MHARLALLAVASLLATGCLAAVDDAPLDPGAAAGLTSVKDRANLPFVRDDEFSRTLVNGTLAMLDVESVFLDVELPVDELGSAADGSAKVHMGLWLPDVPEGAKVPVIADIGPYYSDGDTEATVPAERLGRFLIENFVPHGYAVAQVSVFGTGLSTHCMDLMGRSEQLGIDAAVTWLGSQEWSNGNVGIIGRSYDGSTPWEAATFGNPALKTIVPISGLTGAHELMWRNGSAETRGPIMHNGVYGTFGLDTNPESGNVDPEDRYTACRDYVAGPAQGLGAYLTGDHFLPEVNDYWEERYFLERTLANYKGSVYFIHGLQDWNVDPHMAFPAYQRLQDAGLEVKGLFGQWGHMYPDRASEHENLPEGRGKEAYPASVRLDWAQDLLEWFDHYLKGTGPRPPLHVEVQDNAGGWRIEESYPPLDAAWIEPALCAEGPQYILPAEGNTLVCMMDPLSADHDTRIAGLPQLHLTVTPTGPGGQVYARLEDAETGMHLGHAIMDLRFASGGTRMEPVVPGMAIVARMEFEPMDVLLPAGHGLRLILSGTGEDYLPSAVSSPVLVDQAASVLRLPTIERGAEAFFVPPGPVGDAKGDTPTF
jgi:predicted acyl esterase